MAWNREHLNPDKRTGAPLGPQGPQAQQSALTWSVMAMRETTERLGRISARDRPQAFAVIGEAVWWVTIVDATLVRYHPEAYESALAALPRAQRMVTDGTFAGLRFVRNRMGYYSDHLDFIEPRPAAEGDRDVPVTAWTWKGLPEPAVETMAPRGQAWEMSRYRAYQDHLAGHAVGETFERAAAFLTTLASRGTDGPGELSASGH